MSKGNEVPMLSGWGRLLRPGREVFSEDLERLSQGAVLSRGLGRAYGDAALPPPGAIDVATTVLADRILAFDEQTGVLRAEAGLSLRALNFLLINRGWFTPVTPGTMFVTLGGMVAADVHGKNHHSAGCFGSHVRAIKIRVADGRVIECSPQQESELFWATVGGMGLTGHILEVEVTMARIPSPWIAGESIRIANLDEFVDQLKESGKTYPATAGWIDCISRGSSMGRGILFRGDWAKPETAPKTPPKPHRSVTVPFELPSGILNNFSARAFNEVVYRSHVSKHHKGFESWEKFYYPLDKVLHWNRVYGRRGFTQFQCVLPEAAGRAAVRRFLTLLTSRGDASFLCVIKDCGAEGKGMLSFPMTGTSIALDFPVHSGTQELIDTLNRAVMDEGGRIYLAKDAFTRGEDFRRMDPRVERFLEVRRKWDPNLTLRSAQSVRIFGDPA